MKKLFLILTFLITTIANAQTLHDGIFGQYTTIDEYYQSYTNANSFQNANYYALDIPDTHDDKSGSETQNYNGVYVTISWEVDANLVGIVWWTIYYSDGTYEMFWGSKGQAKQHAVEQAKKKALEAAKKKYEETHSLIIGDYLWCFSFLLMRYCFLIYKRRVTQVRL